MCGECQGTGKKANIQNFEVVIPAGIRHGQKVYPATDLEIVILYAPHPEFALMENMIDIASKIKVSMFDALLGGSVKINTLQGQKSLKITPGTQPGTTLRIKSAGMKTCLNGTFNIIGDHLVEVLVELPKTLTDEQEGLLLKLKKTMEDNGESNG
jgi:DnaJ-class molecular chaperone